MWSLSWATCTCVACSPQAAYQCLITYLSSFSGTKGHNNAAVVLAQMEEQALKEVLMF
jgi:hypothetical protein